MKRMNIFKKATLLLTVGVGLLCTACEDFLTTYPTDKTVLENYWKTKADVEGMVAECYRNMLSEDFVKRAIVWGELRSDNLLLNASNNDNTLKYIVEANLLPNNGYCNWAIYYKVINLCNMVLLYSPQVVEEDPDFTQGDLEVVEGQMYALRALCHFYLVRTFRDIPLALEAMVDDSQPMHYPQVKPLVALDSILSDLRIAENKVLKSGTYTTDAYNKGYVTRDAVRAMIADVLLWKAAFTQFESKEADCSQMYTQAIEACEQVLTAMNELQEEEEKKNLGHGMNNSSAEGEDNPYYLIQNEKVTGKTIPNNYTSDAYDGIFGMGGMTSTSTTQNSSESIFELQYGVGENYNQGLAKLYMEGTKDGTLLMAAPFLGVTSSNSSIFKTTDVRRVTFLDAKNASSSSSDEAEYGVGKYSFETSYGSYRSTSSCDAHWIIYRKADVMLMEAEALALRDAEGDVDKAFNLTRYVNTRSLCNNSDSLLIADYSSASGVLSLVLEERQRELMFEGKRWYDLVRKALREGSTTDALQLMVRKFDGGAGSVQSKMASINTFFFPIAESEMNVNSLLVQNEAYEEKSTTEKN